MIKLHENVGRFLEIDPKKDPITAAGKRYLMFIVKDLPDESSFQVVDLEKKKTSKITYYGIRSFKEVENLTEKIIQDTIKGSFA